MKEMLCEKYLINRNGKHNKVYHIVVYAQTPAKPSVEDSYYVKCLLYGYSVVASYGRNDGRRLIQVVKCRTTQQSLALDVFDDLVSKKVRKGYTESDLFNREIDEAVRQTRAICKQQAKSVLNMEHIPEY